MQKERKAGLAASPIQRLVFIDSRCVTFLSSQSSEVGACLRLGLHIRPSFLRSIQYSVPSDRKSQGCFLDLFGIVVDSKKSTENKDLHHVTLAFVGLEEKTLNILKHLESALKEHGEIEEKGPSAFNISDFLSLPGLN